MNIDMYAFSSNGALLCDNITKKLKDHNIESYALKKYTQKTKYVKERQENLYRSTEKSFREKDCIIFVGACGIAVRAIAPFVKSKKTDPAVICIDEKGKNVISLLSGHIGGANKLALKISNLLDANPVITTATDINGKFAVDQWAHNCNMHILSLKDARRISVEILENKKIGLQSDFRIISEFPDEIDNEEKNTGICISLDCNRKPFKNTLNLIPKIVTVGVGCRKGTDCKIIFHAIKDVLNENNICHWAVKSLNSLELKKDEEGIIKAAEILNVPFNTYTKQELLDICGDFSKSDFVKCITGVDCVCERSALASSKNNELIIKKTIKKSVTVAASIEEFYVDFSK